eukprot:scaffold3.g6712.t1
MAALDAEALKNEWQSLFRLWSNDKGIKLRLTVPDTVVLQHGQPVAWYFSSKEGYVVQQPAVRTTLEEVRAHFLRSALAGRGDCMAIARMADGLPKLLSRQAFAELCARLEEQLAGGAAVLPEETPVLLQAWVPPCLDLRYVTSYSNDGADISCHTFQRLFSRRYLPWRAAPRLLPDVLSEPAAAGVPPAAAATAAAATAADAALPPVDASAALDAVAEGGGSATTALGERELADMERSLDRALGPVDPALKMAMRKAAHGLVQYVQRAHLLTIRGLVCEFVRDSWGNIYFMGPLRVDWASVIPGGWARGWGGEAGGRPGRGGEPWANANLLATAKEEESWPSVSGSEAAEAEAAQEQQPTQSTADLVAAASASADVLVVAEVPVDQEQMQRHASGLPPVAEGAAALEGRPSDRDVVSQQPSQLQQQMPELVQQLQAPGSPTIAAVPSAASPAQGLRSPLKAALAKAASTASTLATAALRRDRLPSQGRPLTNGLAGGTPKSPAMLTSHLTKELVEMKDELVLKTDLAGQLAAKVEALEHDKRVITDAFERVLLDMQSDMKDVKQRLELLKAERDGLAAQLAETQAGRTAAESEREELRARLQEERGTAINTLGSLQAQQEDAATRAARAEEELKALQSRHCEEQVVSDALKKQMIFYQHAMVSCGIAPPPVASVGAGGAAGTSGGASSRPGSSGLSSSPAGLALLRGLERPELRYWEALTSVDDLILREADAEGERYSLAKVLHTCQADLHPIFLHYCLLDAGWVRHWPPQLTLVGWLTFMKETGVTNLVPGTRTRSDTTIHVQEAQEVFRRYSLRQAVMAGGSPTRNASLKPAMSFKALAGAEAPAPLVRPPSAGSAASAPGPRPPSSIISVSSSAGSASLSFQGFCAALVHVAAKTARQSADALEACPFLSEQARGAGGGERARCDVRAYVESIVPKAQRVAPLNAGGKKPAAAGAASGKPGATAAGGGATGAKEAAAKQAAARLPKLKKGAGGDKARPGSESSAAKGGRGMEAISEASQEASLRQGIGPMPSE